MSATDPSAQTPCGAVATALILELFRANGRAMKTGDALGRDMDLTAARWQVLGAVADGPRTVAQIAQRYETSRQGVRWVVRVLEDGGVVELIDNPHHRRASLVRLTLKGEDLFRRMGERQVGWVNALCEGFSIDELSQALDVIARLGARMRQSSPPSRIDR